MKRLLLLALGAAAACNGTDLGPRDIVPEAATCAAPVVLSAWAAATPDATGSVEVVGMTFAPDGVTVRAVYVAGMLVSETDFNFRSWNVTISPDRLRALARDGRAMLPVMAFTSSGCAALPSPIEIDLSSDGGAADATAADATTDVTDGLVDAAGPADAGAGAD